MQGENKTNKKPRIQCLDFCRDHGALLFKRILLDYQCPYSVISDGPISGAWLKLFSKKRESVRQGMSIFLMAPCSKHRRKQSSLFPLGTITA